MRGVLTLRETSYQRRRGASRAATAMAAAHSLKGAAASLGLESIRRLAEAVELAGPSGAIAAARQTLPILADLLDQLAAL